MGNSGEAIPLAIDGGEPVRAKPWPSRGLFGEAEKKVVVEIFDRCIEAGSSIGYNGENEQAYCLAFAEFHGGGFADAVNSGTSALYVALQALELEPFNEVIVPPVTDPGGVMPVPLLNLIPIPADAEPGSFNVGPEQIRERLTERTAAIIVAHIAGIPADMVPILAMARDAGVPVIEDCSQAHGARCGGRRVGTYGDIAIFSTMSGKHHATGAQGGVVFTNDEALYWRCRRASDRGKPFGLPGGSTNDRAALNLNLNDLSAAIGRVQLEKLPRTTESRHRNALALAEGCRRLQTVDILLGPPQAESVFWFILVRLDLDKVSVPMRQFTDALGAEGIPTGAHYRYLSNTDDWFVNKKVFGTSGYPWRCPLYRGDPDRTYDLPNAEAVTRNHFVFKFHENCGPQEVADALAALAKVEAAYQSGGT